MLNKAKIIKDAQKFVAKGQWDKAITEYEKLFKESPNDANTYNTIGDLYLKKNDSDNAIESYKKAAEIFNKSGFTLKAIALYKKVLGIKPEQVDIYLLLGKLNAERGLIGNANESYLAAAAYFSRQGQKGRAIDVYKILCDLNPGNLALAQKLADLYHSEGYQTEAVSKFIDLAEKKIQSGQLDEAKEILDKAAPKGDERFDYKRVLAIYDIRTGRLAEAIENLEEARKIDPGDTRIIELLVEAYRQDGRLSECAGLLAALLEKDPNNFEIRKRLAESYSGLGDFDSAWKECGLLVEKSISSGSTDEAEAIVSNFLAKNADNIEALYCLAGILAKAGKESEVDEVHFTIADLYVKAGENEKAENIYRKLAEKDTLNEKARAALASICAHAPEAETEPAEMPSEGFEPPAEELSDYDLTEEPEPSKAPEPSGPPSYGLPDLPDLDLDELPPVSTGDESEPLQKDSDAFEIPDVDFGGKDEEQETPEIILSEAPVLHEEEEHGGELPDVLDFGEIGEEEARAEEKPAAFEPAVPPALSIGEKLAEIEVYIKYGLVERAQEALAKAESMAPDSAAVKEKRLDVCKALGDIEGFVNGSLTLADIYAGEGRDDEAQEVLHKAAQIDPENEALKVRLSSEVPEGALPTDEPGIATDEELGGDSDEMSFAGLMEDLAEPPLAEGQSEPSVPELVLEDAPQEEISNYKEDISEADFYVHQGLKDEARQIYKRILSLDPENEDVKSKLDSLDGAHFKAPENVLSAEEGTFEPEEPGAEKAFYTVREEKESPSPYAEFDAAFSEMTVPEPEAVSARPEPVHGLEELEAGPAPIKKKEDEDFFDLAAELQEELDGETFEPEHKAEVFEDKQLEAVFKEFKKGVEEQLNREDYETHYNLGIAYKEMGMLDEAVNEFLLAENDPARALDCASMLGLCFMEKGEYGKAIGKLKGGLDISGREPEEYLGLKYDMASAYELMDDIASAQSLINGIAKEDPSFRDVKERLQRLNKTMLERGLSPSQSKPEGNEQPASGKPKKSRVSYL